MGCLILKSLVRGVVIVVIFAVWKSDVVDGPSRGVNGLFKARGGEAEEFSQLEATLGLGPVDTRDARLFNGRSLDF